MIVSLRGALALSLCTMALACSPAPSPTPPPAASAAATAAATTAPTAAPTATPTAAPTAAPSAEAKPGKSDKAGVKPHYVDCKKVEPGMPCTPEPEGPIAPAGN